MGHYLKLVGRDAGACTAVALGVEAAVEFCVALAAELKMDEG